MLKNILKSIRNNVLVGLFLTVPVMVTILIINFLFNLATHWALQRESLLRTLRTRWYGDYLLQLMALLTVVIVFYLVGLLTRNFLGRRLYAIGDKLLAKIPFIKNIYISIRSISESLFTQRKTLFKEVVLVEYPRKGLYSLAFVTAQAPPAVAEVMNKGIRNKPCVSLFISTTPNPTSGVFILAPKSDVIPLDMPVTEALTFIMSAGAVAPGDDIDRPTLLDKLESWLKHESTDHLEEAEDAEKADI